MLERYGPWRRSRSETIRRRIAEKVRWRLMSPEERTAERRRTRRRSGTVWAMKNWAKKEYDAQCRIVWALRHRAAKGEDAT